MVAVGALSPLAPEASSHLPLTDARVLLIYLLPALELINNVFKKNES